MIKIMDYSVLGEDIFIRGDEATGVEDVVADIIYDVRKNGDKALYEYSRKFDKGELSCLEVTKEEIDAAFASVDPALIEIIREAKKAVADHPESTIMEKCGGDVEKINAKIVIDAAKEAARFGITEDRAANYHADHQGTAVIYEAMSEAVCNVRACRPMSADWKRQVDEDYKMRGK